MSDIIIVKIGTESLHDFENSVKVGLLVEGIVEKIRSSTRILLVTSGAVQFGRDQLGVSKSPHENTQVLAAIGWSRLVEAYRKKFLAYQVQVAGYLVTHADIEDRIDRAKTFTSTIEATWDAGFLPIVNENDPISMEEMNEVRRGADNDQNAFLLAEKFHARQLIIITNTNGVYSDANNPSTRIASFQSDELTAHRTGVLCRGKSSSGTGGMQSKLTIAHKAGAIGIDTHIGDGIQSGVHSLMGGGTNIWSVTSYPDFQN